MKDIDFDELDRAVSSVLNQTKPASPAAATMTESDEDAVTHTNAVAVESDAESDHAVAVKTGDIQHHEAQVISTDDEVSSEPAEESEAAEDKGPEIIPVAVPPVPSLATKRRGKFMDVMHPSHDMAPGKTAVVPAPIVKPVLIAPLSDDIPPAVASSEPVAVEPNDEPLVALPTTLPVELPATVDEKETVTETEPTPDSMYVDPIELADTPAIEKAPELTVTEPEEHEAVDDVTDVPSIEEPNIPVVTPFLTDAKVEKRPLGNPQSLEDAADTVPGEELEDSSSLEASADAQIAPTAPLPRELQPDVVRVETMADEDEGKYSDAMPAALKKDDSNEIEGHPLFDASAYHEPTSAKHKSKGMPGWVKWLLGLLLCLAVGAGIGYAMFASGF